MDNVDSESTETWINKGSKEDEHIPVPGTADPTLITATTSLPLPYNGDDYFTLNQHNVPVVINVTSSVESDSILLSTEDSTTKTSHILYAAEFTVLREMGYLEHCDLTHVHTLLRKYIPIPQSQFEEHGGVAACEECHTEGLMSVINHLTE